MRASSNVKSRPIRRSLRPVPITIKPTRADIAIAHAVARHADPKSQAVARALTWGADEKVLLALAALGWFASRGRGEPLRRAGNHALLVTVAASLLPHAFKKVFNQTRPDREVIGHRNGISFSGKAEDAFPSGHALHMGALASAAGSLPTASRRTIRTATIGLSLSRIMLLAHWPSDVLAGYAFGAIMERMLRLWTGYPPSFSKDEADAGS